MRSAADAFEFARDEEITVSAAVVQLMDVDIDAYNNDKKKPPGGATTVRDAAREALGELEPRGKRPRGRHELEGVAAIRRRLGVITDTPKSLGMLVELCACQPWAALTRPAALQKEPRQLRLEQFAVFLGGDTTEEDVAEIDKILYARPFYKTGLFKVLVLLGGAGVGIATAGLAAPAIGAAIGASMGLSGAAATGAGLATLGGGSLAAGGLGVAGGTALVGGAGAVTGVGATAGARKLILDEDFSADAVRIEARKLQALVARLKVHGQSSQARAEEVINRLSAQIDALSAKLESKKLDEKRIGELEKKIKVLTEALERMQAT